MSDLQSKLDDYKSQHGHSPNASQLARHAGVRYSAASNFLRNGSSGASSSNTTHNKSRSQTISFTKPSTATFSPVTKARTSSFSKEIYEPKQNTKSSSTTGVDYSGSTTGANNPWKKFQKSKSTYTGSFSHAFTSKPKPKPKPKSVATYTARPSSPRQSTTSTSTATTATASISSTASKYIPKSTVQTLRTSKSYNNSYNSHSHSPRTTYNTSSSSSSSSASSINRSTRSYRGSQKGKDLNNLTKKYERQCDKIRQQFDAMRNELSRRENDIITDLTNYTNECKTIIQQNMHKMENVKNNSPNVSAKVSNNGYAYSKPNHVKKVNTQKVVSHNNNVNTFEHKEEKQAANNNTSNSNNSSVDNNPYSSVDTNTNANTNTRQQERVQQSEQTQPTSRKTTSTTTTIKSFVAKPQKDVDSDEWSDSEGSWN